MMYETLTPETSLVNNLPDNVVIIKIRNCHKPSQKVLLASIMTENVSEGESLVEGGTPLASMYSQAP